MFITEFIAIAHQRFFCVFRVAGWRWLAAQRELIFSGDSDIWDEVCFKASQQPALIFADANFK